MDISLVRISCRQVNESPKRLSHLAKTHPAPFIQRFETALKSNLFLPPPWWKWGADLGSHRQVCEVGIKGGREWKTRVLVLVLPLACCATLGKSQSLSGPFTYFPLNKHVETNHFMGPSNLNILWFLVTLRTHACKAGGELRVPSSTSGQKRDKGPSDSPLHYSSAPQTSASE